MSEQILAMDIDGLNELIGTFDELVKKYPDRAGDMLQKNAKSLRKDVVEEVKNVTKTEGSSKRSLGKLSSYKISPVKGYGVNQFVEISAKSPHFHLVENGHQLIINGENRGFVQGKHMMATAVKKHQESMPEAVSNMVDELLKEEGLI